MTVRHQKTCLLLALSVLLFIASGCSAAKPEGDESRASRALTIAYTLRAEPIDGAWRVEAELPSELGGSRVCAPSIGTRDSEFLEWSGVEVGGSALALNWSRDGCFDLPRSDLPFRLSYRVGITPPPLPTWRAISLSPASDGAALFFPGETLFLEFVDLGQGRYLPTTVSIQSEGPVATTLTRDGEEWFAENNQRLIRSVVWTSPKVQASHVESAGGALTLWREPTLPDLSAELLCISDQLDQWAPGRASEEGAVFLLGAHWDTSAKTGFARQGGVIVQMGSETLEDPLARQRLMAHELFHRYNGESLTYREDKFEETSWFREGATNYVALVTLAHAGLFSAQEALYQLSQHATTYLTNPAVSESGARDLDWQRLPYDQGVMLSLALDLILRDVSAGTRSLQGFLRFLSRDPRWEQAQTNRILKQSINDYAGADLSDFFEKYITQDKLIPVHALLVNAGADVIPYTHTRFQLEMQVSHNVDSGTLEVTQVKKGGVADKAGIQRGDLIVPTSETNFEPGEGFVAFELQRGTRSTFVRFKPQPVEVAGLALQLSESKDAPLKQILSDTAPVSSCEAISN